MDAEAKFQVWWIPQVPGKPFEVEVPSLDEGIRLCNTLADYDLFQWQNQIKPDYSNAGGVRYSHPVITQGDWDAIDIEDEDEVLWLKEELAKLEAAS